MPPGQNLQVYAPTAAGGFNTTSLTNLLIPTGDSAPAATTTATMSLNLPANATAPADAPFSPAIANSYNQSTSLTVYDSLGAAHTASIYFVNTGARHLGCVRVHRRHRGRTRRRRHAGEAHLQHQRRA